MAVESPALLHALVAFSAANLSSFDQTRKIVALEMRSKALASLSVSLGVVDGLAKQETNLAACLVLSTLEISCGHCDGWYEHLRGAKQLISSARSSSGSQIVAGSGIFKQSSEGKWLLRNFAYHDIMGSIVSGHALRANPRDVLAVDGTIDSYFGVALDVLVLIADISCLDLGSFVAADDRHNNPEPIVDDDWTRKTMHSIENQLREWQCPSVTDPALHAMANAYRHAGLLYLYNRVWSLPECGRFEIAQPHRIEEELQSKVKKTILHLSKISFNGYTEGSLLFPLFMVGASTSHSESIDMVRKRLRYILSNRGFQNCATALKLLEKILDLPRLGGRGLNLS